MKIIEVLEARRNPEQNPKLTPDDQLKELIEKYGSNNMFIRLSGVNKFGANPLAFYNTTPLGIYGYPIDYVLKQGIYSLPFPMPTSPSARYVIVFKLSDDAVLWNLGQDDQDLLEQVRTACFEVVSKSAPKYTAYFKQQLSNATSTVKLWKLIKNLYRYGIGPDTPSLFRRIFLTAGIDAVVDPGTGLIHDNEPTQAVFFNIKKVKQIGLIDKIRKGLPTKIDMIYNPKYQEYEEVPARYTTRSQWLELVKHGKYDLSDVPKQFVDYKMCLAASKYFGWGVLRFLPKVDQKYLDLALLLLKKRGSVGADWQYVDSNILKRLEKIRNLKDQLEPAKKDAQWAADVIDQLKASNADASTYKSFTPNLERPAKIQAEITRLSDITNPIE